MCALMSLYIPHIEYGIDAQFIANVFYYQNIATIKRITLVPYIKPIGKYDYMCFQRAYIDIHMWHDSEVAYNFIQRVKKPKVEARIIYDIIDEACWWIVEENYLPWITTSKKMKKKTTQFEIINDDERIEEILVEEIEKLEKYFRGRIELDKIDEIDRYFHPIDDEPEWRELEQLIQQESKKSVITIEV
jgi:hypothetical protein